MCGPPSQLRLRAREVTDPTEHERKAKELVDRLEALIPGYRAAADEAGNRLAQEIAAHKDQWVENLAAQADELAATYNEALAEARLALAAFVPARAGLNWVSNFDSSLAESGRYSQFSGGRLRVTGRRAGIKELRGEFDPATLLAVAAAATAPPPAPPPSPASSRSKVAA